MNFFAQIHFYDICHLAVIFKYETKIVFFSDSKEDPNHNSKKSKKMMDQGDQLTATSNCSNSEDEHSVATAVDANMASEESEADDSASMKLEEH